jgi:hypothetical protein
MNAEERKDARGYAWGYFALHAGQRMNLFNFFLVLSGLILGAFPAVRGIAHGTRLVALLPTLLVLTAFTFWRLDERTRRLIKNAEAALRFLDNEWTVEAPVDSGPHCLCLIARDDYLTNMTKRKWWSRAVPTSYTDSFRLAYLMIGGVGIALAWWAWI